ncbi:cell division protein FtsQ/DivIB [Hahella sp. HN01]|uniref:cell division protein FtsQ/DivIB n=2 Tax=unclassified Hahella TaxID=2624107 RepID=UPI001C1EF728|nr:FtsQ-type POTRA domain-containing protein [Hahella sp. HN01]
MTPMKKQLDKSLGSRRGATATRARERADNRNTGPAAIVRLLAFIPWNRVLLHVSIFCFWLLVLSALIAGVKWLDRPVATVQVVGELNYVSRGEVKELLAPLLNASFFTSDLEGVRKSLETHPWIKRASISRLWPDAVQVDLEEEEPFVRWRNQGYINEAGRLFVKETGVVVNGLPSLIGPPHSERLVFDNFQKWKAELAKVGLDVNGVIMESRGAWLISFTDGWELNLGKQDVEGRLHRFTVLFDKKLHQEREKIASVDARYTRGVAVKWKADVTPEQG